MGAPEAVSSRLSLRNAVAPVGKPRAVSTMVKGAGRSTLCPLHWGPALGNLRTQLSTGQITLGDHQGVGMRASRPFQKPVPHAQASASRELGTSHLEAWGLRFLICKERTGRGQRFPALATHNNRLW